MRGSDPGLGALADVVEELLVRVRGTDPDAVVRRLAETDPAAADRLLTGLVLVGEALTVATVGEQGTRAAGHPRARRHRIHVRDDDAVSTTASSPTTRSTT